MFFKYFSKSFDVSCLFKGFKRTPQMPQIILCCLEINDGASPLPQTSAISQKKGRGKLKHICLVVKSQVEDLRSLGHSVDCHAIIAKSFLKCLKLPDCHICNNSYKHHNFIKPKCFHVAPFKG